MSGEEKIRDVMNSPESVDPISAIEKTYVDDPATAISARNMLLDQIAPNGYVASKVLEGTEWGQQSLDNKTTRILREKADEFSKVVSPVLGIQKDWNDVGERDEEYYKLVYGRQIENAAIKAFAESSPLFKKQAISAGVDFNSPDLAGKFPSSKLGQIVTWFLQRPDIWQYIQDEKPFLINGLNALERNLLTEYEDYGINVVANEVSQEREKEGVNAIEPIFNFYGDTNKEITNLTAERLYRNDPVKMKIYDKFIRNNQEQYIDASSLFEGIAGGIKGIFSGIKSTVMTTPFETLPEMIKKGWEKEATNVSANPTGLVKFLRDSGHALGTVAGIGATGSVSGGGSLANTMSIVLPFFGESYENSIMKFPDSPVKAYTSALFNTALFAAMGKNIFPVNSVKNALTKFTPEVQTVVNNLANGSISREVARREMNTIGKQVFDFLAGTTMKTSKIAGELTSITALNNILDKMMGISKEAENQYNASELETLKSMFLSNIMVGAMSKIGDIKKKNTIAENSYYAAASNPVRYRRLIEDIDIADPSLNKEEMLQNLDFLVKVKQNLEQRGVPERLQGRYMFEAMKARLAEAQKAQSPDAVLRRQHDEIIRGAQEVQEQILKGEEPEGGKYVIEPDEISKPIELSIETPEGSKGYPKVEYNDKGEPYVPGIKIIEPNEKSEPVELSIETPEGSKGFPKVEYDDKGRPYLPKEEPNTQMAETKVEEKPTVTVDKEIDAINRALTDGTLKGANADMAKTALSMEGGVDMLLKEIADQALGKVGTLEMGAENMRRARQVYGDELVDMAIAKFPKEEGGVAAVEPMAEVKPETAPETGPEVTPTAEPIEPKVQAERTALAEPPKAEPVSGAPTPPEPPKASKKAEQFNGSEREKGILSRLYNAAGTPAEAKRGFEKEGLKYETKSQSEAESVAKSVLDEFGIDEAVELAKSEKFDGDVNSLIFGEALNRLAEQDAASGYSDAKAAQKYAEVAISYDEAARKGGRFNAAINYFYKNSPLGVVMKENADRQAAFDAFAQKKGREESWEQGFKDFNEAMQDPEFARIFKEQVDTKVAEQVKKERAATRAARKERVHKAIDDTMAKWAKSLSIKNKDDVQKQGIGDIDKILKVAADGIKKAYDAGESVVKIVQDAIDYISRELGTDNWDKETFRKEWTDKLADYSSGKRVLTEAEIKERYIERLRKKLNGLSEKKKNEVIRKVFEKAIEKDALEYADLRKIIADVLGYEEVSPEQAAKIKELVNKKNGVIDAAKKAQEEITDEALENYYKAQIEAGKAQRELGDMLYNKPDVLKRMNSILQLNTLGFVSLAANVSYNFWNQLGVRFPVFLINDVVDRSIGAVAKVFGSNYERQYNVLGIQADFWSKLGLGTKEAMTQLITGLNRMDYTQKELYGQQIRPARAIRSLIAHAQGKKKLTKSQILDKALQASFGIPAEIVARLLNVGDKPLRFGAEGATAATFAKNLGLKGIDKKLFVLFPKEQAYRQAILDGLTEKQAQEKAEFIERAIIKEGQRSTFQQDNLFNDALNRAFGVLGGKESGIANTTKTLAVSPFIKIPTNAFWSYYNLANPEVAIIQAFAHAGIAKGLSNKGKSVDAKLQMREARYWFAHAVVGIAYRSLILSLLGSGVISPGNTGDEQKKEREGEMFFSKPGTIDISKLMALINGKDPNTIKNGLVVQMKWFGQFGSIANSIAQKYEDMTPEQREAQNTFWNAILGGMEIDALKELESGVFANSSSLFQSISNGDFSRYGLNTLNLFANIVQPASIAQYNRAKLDEVPVVRGDNFLEKLKQSFAQRSPAFKKLFDVQLKKKRSIWGEPIKKTDNMFMRLFGISRIDDKKDGRPMFDDYLRTADLNFLPPSVPNILNGQKLNTEQIDRLEEYVGQGRKMMALPIISDNAKIPLIGKKYSQLNDDEKKRVLAWAYQEGRAYGLEKFYQDYPEFKKPESSIEEQVSKSMWEAAYDLMKLNLKKQ